MYTHIVGRATSQLPREGREERRDIKVPRRVRVVGLMTRGREKVEIAFSDSRGVSSGNGIVARGFSFSRSSASLSHSRCGNFGAVKLREFRFIWNFGLREQIRAREQDCEVWVAMNV